MELAEGVGQAVEIGPLAADHAVGVVGGPGGAVGVGGGSANQQVLDAVAVEDLDQAAEVVGRAVRPAHGDGQPRPLPPA